MNETKSPLKSKTVMGNSGLLAVYTIVKWAFPDFDMPQDVLVSFVTLANILLRLSSSATLKT